MEYVIVDYPERRTVNIDDHPQGYNKDENGNDRILRVGAGRKTFSLGGANDYEPESQVLVVENTNPINPMRVEFTPKDSIDDVG